LTEQDAALMNTKDSSYDDDDEKQEHSVLPPSLQQQEVPSSATTTSTENCNNDDDNSTGENRDYRNIIQAVTINGLLKESALQEMLKKRRTPKKQTSCDVELDISVEHILNILDVMHELPGDTQERQQTHWRAVPSLREIWSQERRRMAKLLSPDEDFLSCSASQTTCSQNDNNSKNSNIIKEKIRGENTSIQLM
jgi:hypothetical protein